MYSKTVIIPLFKPCFSHANKLCSSTRIHSKYRLFIPLILLIALCVPLPILVIFSWIWLTRTFQFSQWVWIGTLYNSTNTSLLLLEMFCLEHLRIGFAFFTDVSHYFRNLIPLKETIKLKWHWNKLIPTLTLCWLSKQSTFLADVFPSLCIRFHRFVIKIDFSV